MIEPTGEMIADAMAAYNATGAYRPAVAAVLAIVERDYDVSPKLPPVEHRQRRDIWWNHYSERYEAECVCGESFVDWPESAAKDRLLDHIQDEARP